MPTNVRCKLLTKINIPFARVKKYVGQETAHTFNLTQIHTHTHTRNEIRVQRRAKNDIRMH